MKLFHGILKKITVAENKEHGIGKVSQRSEKAWIPSKVRPGKPKHLQGKTGQSLGLKPRGSRQEQSLSWAVTIGKTLGLTAEVGRPKPGRGQ